MALRKAGSNWVDGDRFFDRETELEALRERVKDGTHTLLTAQRRMGKTSLVRELLRQLAEEGDFETVFVDLEAANGPEDAVAEIAVQSKSVSGAWLAIKTAFANSLRGLGKHVDELSVSEAKIKLRAGMNPGDWRLKGDQIFQALARSDKPVALAIDELPILVNRLLKGSDHIVTTERTRLAEEFLSWLRKNGQTHRGKFCLILSGSIGLQPVLHQVGLTAHANIYAPFDLRPWNQETATDCLAELAEAYNLDLSQEVRAKMCWHLRSLVPHHVQKFFDHLHEHLRRQGRHTAALEDVTHVYEQDLLGVRGQTDLDHYESRLKVALDPKGYNAALELLTEAAKNDGLLSDEAVARYNVDYERTTSLQNVLHVLEHDGYLEPSADGYRFVSALLEDWWRARHGRHFVPIAEREPSKERTGDRSDA